ncbi:MAG: HupE/UreJ family protein [Gammaproteobacteria bacterium]|nr:HupE/UreJ family protein [Gammaproteobacteria bacterium]
MNWLERLLGAFLITLVLTPWAQAHEIRPAYLKITQLGASDLVSYDDVDLEESAGNVFYEASLRQPQIDGRFLGLDLATNCATTPQSASLSGEALIEVSLLRCNEEGLTKVEILGLERTMIDTLVSITDTQGSISNHLITAQEASLDLSVSKAALPVYLLIGFEHLVLGYDHILFVLMLLYLVSTPRQILWVVSSFTLAHSLTLALSAFGIVIVAQRPIEAAIAASIVLLAYETLTNRRSLSHRVPELVAFAFGLIHGLGFAGALSEIGLPEGSQLGALLLFNLGIELGQLLIVIAALVLAVAARRALRPHINDTALDHVSAIPAILIGGIASYWFIQRAAQILLPFLA